MISQKVKAKQDARKEAEKARQQAMLKACGYSALKKKHRTSLQARASRPEGEAGGADL